MPASAPWLLTILTYCQPLQGIGIITARSLPEQNFRAQAPSKFSVAPGLRTTAAGSAIVALVHEHISP